MNDAPGATPGQPNIWLRGLYMLVMALAYQITGTVLFIVTVIQFVIALLNGQSNVRLVTFGRSLGRYLQQTVEFLTFASAEIPFPFNDWPAGD
jgi:hypothetical protein